MHIFFHYHCHQERGVSVHNLRTSSFTIIACVGGHIQPVMYILQQLNLSLPMVLLILLANLPINISLAMTSRHMKSCQSPLLSNPSTRETPIIPDKIIVGYANWNQCDESIIKAVEEGVNVIIWFAINLAEGPTITNGPNIDCVSLIAQKLKEKGLDVIHLISIGGWNSPHPSTENSAEKVFDNWHIWNTKDVARPERGWFGFDGFDWDIEGNDDPDSEYNSFKPECLDLMGKFSQLAKKAGYVVAMAPAESYLDPTTSDFSLSLRHTYPEWVGMNPTNNFSYHGRNTYAYILAKYNETCIERARTIEKDGEIDENFDQEGECRGEEALISRIPTFDFVTIQLYEGYSHAMYKLGIMGVHPSDYLNDLVEKFENGWMVNFSSQPEVKTEVTIVSVQ